ncbi:D-alanine:D-lactate ligase-like protein [Aquibium carbonis]|uniref:D-alanine:D-lactate ligase-like protein n=1 Tax=Aquibium carbonis TaxID=2495581 RepID=A0A429Z1J0_9HYPH|nr:D-alanine:D-lactate ligase-like protein [Aquibium carbonis]RST87612.1 D-alanine:D-lactate ligase-like protein [Aquibium carbonis]
MLDSPILILVYEPERACQARLAAEGYTPDRAAEISSYLAQSTDIAAELEPIARECKQRGIGFVPLALDDLPRLITAYGQNVLVWTMTDGIAYFRGGAAPALARLEGLSVLGSDDSLFALCQDKFRSGAVLRAHGMPTPEAGLARDGNWIAPPPTTENGWFVKPNRLGAKIGIWPDSHCRTPEEALDISRRIHSYYRDDAIVQRYVAGRNVRASFLAVEPDSGPKAVGAVFVDSGGDFQTMADSLALHGDTGSAARADGRYVEPELVSVASRQPGADAAIRTICGQLMEHLGLRDVFSADFRVEADDSVHLLEFEVCPGLPCFDFRDYCRRQWDLSLAEAIAETAARRLS